MVINTKFNFDDNVFIIHNDQIIKRSVVGVSTQNQNIYYNIRISKALSMLDKDIIVLKDESSCFSTIEEMCKFYEDENR